MTAAPRDDRKAIADRLRELALLVEAGYAEASIAMTVGPTRRHHKLEIVESRRELLNTPTFGGPSADTAA